MLINTVLINRGKLDVIYRQVGMGSDWGVNLEYGVNLAHFMSSITKHHSNIP
jgi:hypothetical protein